MLLGKYLEPVWGTREFLRFILIINTLSTISTYVLVIFAYMLFRHESFLYYYYWCGFSGIVCGLTVAIKQLDPERQIGISVLSIRAKYIPTISVVIVLVLSVCGIIYPGTPFILCGVYFSWFYLRFMQKRGEVIGDMNDTFSFSSFFPDVIA